jgi:hypothetical protein
VRDADADQPGSYGKQAQVLFFRDSDSRFLGEAASAAAEQAEAKMRAPAKRYRAGNGRVVSGSALPASELAGASAKASFLALIHVLPLLPLQMVGPGRVTARKLPKVKAGSGLLPASFCTQIWYLVVWPR